MLKFRVDGGWRRRDSLCRDVFDTLSNICNGDVAVNYFCKQAPSQRFGKVLNTPLFVPLRHRRSSVKKDFLKNFANFTGEHLCWSLFLIKLQVFKSATWCFPMKIFGIFKNTYFEEHLQTTASVHENVIKKILIFL